jgi:hypothetical protein
VPHRPKLGHIVQTVDARGLAYATCATLQQLVARQSRGRGFGIVYCLRTADKVPDATTEVFILLGGLQEKRRADERTRTADLVSLRVIHQALQGCAGDCKSRILRRLSLLQVAARCTALAPGGVKYRFVLAFDLAFYQAGTHFVTAEFVLTSAH